VLSPTVDLLLFDPLVPDLLVLEHSREFVQHDLKRAVLLRSGYPQPVLLIGFVVVGVVAGLDLFASRF